MRFLGAAVALGTSIASSYVAYGPLHNLWADYQDSPASTYLLVASPFVLISLVTAGVAVWLVWPSKR